VPQAEAAPPAPELPAAEPAAPPALAAVAVEQPPPAEEHKAAERPAPAKKEKKAAAAPAEPPPSAELAPPPVEEAKPSNKRWYVVKVQSGREEAIRDAIERRVRKEGLEEYYGQIVIPVEKITEVKVDKSGKRTTRTKDRKLYPGYLMAEVEYNDRVLYLFRETPGVGDFVGGMVNRPPPPMSDREIAKILGPQGPQGDVLVPTPPKGLSVGDRVKVTDGAFNGMEGEVKKILEAAGKVEVELTIFGRPVKLDLEYYQIEQA
jgi:transcriptional antiterminator NusG